MITHKASSIAAENAAPSSLDLLDRVDGRRLRDTVEALAWPRHYLAQPEANLRAGDWLVDDLKVMGWQVSVQGPYRNIIATSRVTKPVRIFGAHYDSVPTTPGADDNLSAVAAVLEAARVRSLKHRDTCSTAFVFFNREEDGLLGSLDFANSWLPKSGWKIEEAHILEMVGCCEHGENTQRTPPGMPIKLPSKGDFLGLLANKNGAKLLKRTLARAHGNQSDFHVLGLEVLFGVERWFGDLLRSDHAPFWSAKIPALMWTDTSEFRNPRYHTFDDTPDSLDYEFLRSVTQLLLLQEPAIFNPPA